MRPVRRAAVTGLFALWLAPLPALAGSQSSNSSSSCSDGQCSRVDTYVVEDRFGRRGWTRVERREEGQPPGWLYDRGRAWRYEHRLTVPWYQPPRRWTRDDDDD